MSSSNDLRPFKLAGFNVAKHFIKLLLRYNCSELTFLVQRISHLYVVCDSNAFLNELLIDGLMNVGP